MEALVGKPKHLDKNMPLFQFDQHKSLAVYLQNEPGLMW
jgi:hypothetical protein